MIVNESKQKSEEKNKQNIPTKKTLHLAVHIFTLSLLSNPFEVVSKCIYKTNELGCVHVN